MNTNTIEVSKEIAFKVFQGASAEGKEIIHQLIGKQYFDPYHQACEKLGIPPLPELADRTDKDQVSADAYYRLTICIRAKNMVDGKVWEPHYKGGEYHYFPRWTPNSSGFGFSHTGYDIWATFTTVGSRLEYRTYNLMEEGVKEFDVYYQDYLNN